MGIFDGVANLVGTIATNKQNESLMREAWGREDTAVQRRMADLRGAGINPVLAAGQAATTMGPARMEAPRFSGLGGDDVELYKQVTSAKTQLDILEAQRDATRMQANLGMYNAMIARDAAELSDKTKTDRYFAAVDKYKAEQYIAQQAIRDSAFFQKYGIPSTSSGQARTFAELTELVKQFPEISQDIANSLIGGFKDILHTK